MQSPFPALGELISSLCPLVDLAPSGNLQFFFFLFFLTPLLFGAERMAGLHLSSSPTHNWWQQAKLLQGEGFANVMKEGGSPRVTGLKGTSEII